MKASRPKPNLWVSQPPLTANMTSRCTVTSISSQTKTPIEVRLQTRWRSRITRKITSIPLGSNREDKIRVEAQPTATRSSPREVSCKNLWRVQVNGKTSRTAKKFHSEWVMKATTKSTTSIWALDLIRTTSLIWGKSSMWMEPQRRPYPRNRLRGETRIRWIIK